MSDATVEPVFKIGCRVKGRIHMYFVEKCADIETARQAVKLQVPDSNPVLGVLFGAGSAIVKEKA